jgi:polyisoprenoid-binding protein YceI
VTPLAHLALVSTLCGLTAGSLEAQADPDSAVYHLTGASHLDVRTGKAGLFGFAGHEHLIRANAPSGVVVFFPGSPERSRVHITVLTDSLQVLSPSDTAEVRKVTETMRTEVLHVDRYPEISFESKAVTANAHGYQVRGVLTMEGQGREVTVDLRTTMTPDSLLADGSFSVKQSDFGIKPYSGGPAGTVKVADRVTFQLHAVAVAGGS